MDAGDVSAAAGLEYVAADSPQFQSFARGSAAVQPTAWDPTAPPPAPLLRRSSSVGFNEDALRTALERSDRKPAPPALPPGGFLGSLLPKRSRSGMGLDDAELNLEDLPPTPAQVSQETQCYCS